MLMMLCIMKIESLMKYICTYIVYEKKKLTSRLKLHVLNFIPCDLEKYTGRSNVKLFTWTFSFKSACTCNSKTYVCLTGL